LSAFERIQVASGKSVTSRNGLTISNRGVQHDSFEDGRTELWVELHFKRGDEQTSRGPTLLAPSKLDHVLGHCWRLTDTSHERVVIELAATAP